jgi:hypothetical protein
MHNGRSLLVDGRIDGHAPRAPVPESRSPVSPDSGFLSQVVPPRAGIWVSESLTHH